MKKTITTLALSILLTSTGWASGGTAINDKKDLSDLSFEEFLEMSDEEISAALREGAIDLCLREGTPSTYLQYWDLTVIDATPSILYLDGILYSDFVTVNWDVSGTYNKATKTIVVTATNPAPDFCTFFSDFFTNTGTNVGPNFSGTWVNNCGPFVGTWTGVGRVGDCPAARLAPGAAYAGGAIAARDSAPVGSATLFPNPASDFVQLDLSNYQGKNLNVQVYNVAGSLVAQLYSGIAEQGMLTWSTSNHPNGLYLVRVVSDTDVQTLSVQVAH